MGGSPPYCAPADTKIWAQRRQRLNFSAAALCFESAHISNQPFNYLHAGRCNLMVLPRSKNVIAFALNKSNSSLLTEIEITELLSQSWRPPGVEQKIHCWVADIEWEEILIHCRAKHTAAHLNAVEAFDL